jgi:hypothetical protein
VGVITFDAGSIEATLDVDRTPFQQGLSLAKQEARDFADSRPTVTLGLDDTVAKAELARFKDQLQQLNDRRVASPRIGLDTTAAETQLRHLQEQLQQLGGGRANVGISDAGVTPELARITAQLDDLGRRVARPRVEIDTQAARAALDDLRARLQALNAYRANPQVDLDGYALARAQIASLQHQLDQLSRTRANPSVGGINNLGSASRGAADRVAGLRLSLLGAAAALSPGLIPIAAVATAGILGFGGALAAAGAGAGLFGFAMKSNLTPVLDAVKNFSKQGEAALAGLTDAQKAVANELIHLKLRWEDAANSVKPQSYAVATSVLQGLSQALDKLRPLLTNAANAFQILAAGFEKATRGRTFSDFADFLSRQAAPAILTFGKALGDLGATVAHVFEAFEPVIRPAEQALLRFTGSLRTWSEGLKTNNGFQKFLDYVRTNGPLVARTIGDLWHAITSLVAALAPLGPPIVLFVDNMARFIRQIADNGVARGAIKQLADALSGLAKFLGSDWGKLTLIAIGIRAIGAAVTSNPWIVALGTAILAFGWLYDHDHELAIGLGLVAAAMWAVNYAGYGLYGVPWIALFAGIGVGVYEAIKHWDGLKHAIGSFVSNLPGWGHNIEQWSKDAGHWLGEEWSKLGHNINDRWVPNALSNAQHGISKFFGGVVDLFSAHNWAALGDTLARYVGPNSTIGHILRFEWLGSAFDIAKHHFASGIGTIGSTVAGWGKTAWGWGRDLVAGLFNGIKDALGSMFSGIGHWFSDAIFGPIKRALGIASPSTIMMGIGRDLILGLVNGIKGALGLLTGALASIPGRIRGFFNGAGGWLRSHGSQIMQGLRLGIVSGYNTVAGWMSGIRGRISRFTASAGSWIVSHGRSLMSGLRNGIVSGYSTVSGWLSGLRGRVSAFTASAGSWIVSHGSALMRGMASGISSGYGAVSGFLSTIHSRVVGFFAGAGSWLFNAGRNIVQGIANGISAGIGAVGNAISAVTSFISSHLPHSPAKIGPLSGQGSPDIAGLKIANMIADGLKQGIPRIAAAAQAAAAVVAASQRLTTALVQQQANDHDGTIHEDEIGWDAATMGNRRYSGARFPNGQIRPTTIRNNNVTYHLNGVGPDVAAALRELDRQRAFLMGV